MSTVVSNMEHMVTVEFEQGCVKSGFHLLLNEILQIMSEVLSDSNAHIMKYLLYHVILKCPSCYVVTVRSLYYIY